MPKANIYFAGMGGSRILSLATIPVNVQGASPTGVLEAYNPGDTNIEYDGQSGNLNTVAVTDDGLNTTYAVLGTLLSWIQSN